MESTFSIDINAFNVVCGAVTLISFIFAVVQLFTDKGFKKHVEANLLSLIGLLDKAAAMDDEPEYEKSHVALVAANARDQAIGLLRSFSNANRRLATFDFGFDDEETEEMIKKRREATGMGLGAGCLLSGQKVLVQGGEMPIEEIDIGCGVVSWMENVGNSDSLVESKQCHVVTEYLYINDNLAITPNNLIYVRDAGWKDAGKLVIGDQLKHAEGAWVPVYSIEKRTGKFLVHAMATTNANFYSNGILVHNKKT